MVVYFHLQAVSDPAGMPHFGGSGVDLFFVISGFIMVHTTKAKPPTPAQFLVARFARIAPIYWLITLATFSAALLAPNLFKSTTADLKQLILSLLFIPFSKAGGFPQPILFVRWTLNLEMFFYAIFAAGLSLRPYARGAWVAAAVVSVIGLGKLIWPVQGVLWDFYCRPLLLEFAMGMAIGLLTGAIEIHRVAGHRRLIASIGAFSVALLICAREIWPNLDSLFTGGIPSVGAVAAAVLLEQGGWRLAPRWSVRLGDASYSLYLTHPYVTELCGKIEARMHLHGAPSLILLVVGVSMAAFVAWIVFRFVETPITRIARSLLAGRNPSQANSVRAA